MHQIFSLARDWSKRATWSNIPQLKLGNIRGYSPIFKTDNSLNLAAKICSDICPWTLSVSRISQFSESFALGKLFASRTDNFRGQISEHIFAPNEGYCLHIFKRAILRLVLLETAGSTPNISVHPAREVPLKELRSGQI